MKYPEIDALFEERAMHANDPREHVALNRAELEAIYKAGYERALKWVLETIDRKTNNS